MLYARAEPAPNTALPLARREALGRLAKVALGPYDDVEIARNGDVVFFTAARHPTRLSFSCVLEAMGGTPFVVLFPMGPPGGGVASAGRKRRARQDFEPRVVLAMWPRGPPKMITELPENLWDWAREQRLGWILRQHRPVQDILLGLTAGNPWYRRDQGISASSFQGVVTVQFFRFATSAVLGAMCASAWFKGGHVSARSGGELRITLDPTWSN